MLQFRRGRKVLILLITLIIFITFVNVVNAEINKDYYDLSVKGMTVVDDDLDLKIQGSSVLGALGLLVYAVGSLLEWVLGWMFQLISGTNIFPWADAIVFNAIPLLDVNFINPTTTGTSIVYLLKDVLSSLYSAVFGIAISFFSIAVMVMAIKLIISTIAEEKAKYKQAIIHWLMGLLLLFTVHYLISFMFYLNETLVETASEIVVPKLQEAEDNINSLNTDEEKLEQVKKFVSTMEANDTVTDWVKDVYEYIFGSPDYTEIQFKEAKENVLENYLIAAEILNNEDIMYFIYDREGTNIQTGEGVLETIFAVGDEYCLIALSDVVTRVTDGANRLEHNRWSLQAFEERIEAGEVLTGDYLVQYKYYKGIFSIYDRYVLRIGTDVAVNYSIISNLATFFKEATWTIGEGSWKADTVVIQYALLYAIFVVQSLILFIAYVKRLFYIVILALMAPIVVVFDFFNKSVG